MSVIGWTTPGSHLWQVPAGVLSIQVVLRGADGASPNANNGGSGATVSFTLAVTPGDSYLFDIGSKGLDNGGPSGANSGGQNGEGTHTGGDGGDGIAPYNCGGGGGGASRMWKAGTPNTLVGVAGAGGGAAGLGSGFQGGAAGALSATAGAGAGPNGGGGGTQTAGGAYTGSGGAGTAGAFQQGGKGGRNTVFNGGGGGGDGWWGGGGGGLDSGTGNNASGGGGGSSNLLGAGTTSVTSTAGTRGGSTGRDGSITVTYDLPPNQPTLTNPPNNSNIDQTLATTFSWTFSDPDPGDVQASADFQWRTGTGAWTVVTAAATSAQQYIAGANAFSGASGLAVEWQVRTTDNHGNIGPWSDSRFFTPHLEPAAPTISPIPVIINSTPQVSFSAGYSFLNYQARVVNDVAGSPGSTVVADTGTQVVTARTTQTVTLPVYAGYVNGVKYHIQVRTTQYPGDWSPWADSGAITVALGSPPLAPTAVVTPNPLTASIVVAVVNPGSDPNPPNHNDVYRTDLTGNGDEMRIATGVAVNGSYVDALAGANLVYRYRVVAVTAAGASASST